MLCKGIIDKVIDPYSARVRIPIYHQIESSPFATKSEDLPIASICTVPGIEMALKAGDIVYVDFELDQREDPVIVGCLSRKDSTSSSNISTQSIKVDVDYSLPGDLFTQQTIYYEGGGGDSDIGFIFDDGSESTGGDIGFVFG